MASRTFPANPKLLIFSDEGQKIGENEPLDPSSTRYQEVERCIHMALKLLESPEGKNSLVKVAESIVTNRRSQKPPKPTLYQGGPMSGYIDIFLRCMRNDFPMTYLSSMEGEAMAVRQANDMKSIGVFEPKKIGYMDINRYVFNNMIAASKRNDTENYMLFRFQMVISIAHEIVHFLTGFLTGEKADRLGTPPGTSAAGYGNRRTGEAGRYWEEFFLGGQMEMWPNAANRTGTPMYVLQAGTPYLMADGTPKAVAKLVDTNYIKQFMGSKVTDYRVRTMDRRSDTTREELRKKLRDEMSEVRWKNRNNAQLAAPALPGSANRKIPKYAKKGISMVAVPSR